MCERECMLDLLFVILCTKKTKVRERDGLVSCVVVLLCSSLV